MFLLLGFTFWGYGQFTNLFITPAYSWDWYCCGPMCSNFGIYCYRTPVCGDQGGRFLLSYIYFSSSSNLTSYLFYISWLYELEFSYLNVCILCTWTVSLTSNQCFLIKMSKCIVLRVLFYLIVLYMQSTVVQGIVTSVNICALLFVIAAGGYLGFKSGWVGYELQSGYFKSLICTSSCMFGL